jgi:hypothetical protein
VSLDKSSLDNRAWRKSLHSAANGACVEVASTDGEIAIRDSKNPNGPVLRYSTETWHSFLKATKRGFFGTERL